MLALQLQYDHSKAMTDVKEIIMSPQCLARFDPSRPIVLMTDASRIGLGFILVQPGVNDQAFDENGRLITTSPTSYTLKKAPKGRLVVCGSRFISSTESNYAVIELEMLALVWAIQKSRLYLAGSRFDVVTDHQPLVAICNGKNLDAINNMRIQRLLAKTLGYDFIMERGQFKILGTSFVAIPNKILNSI